MRPNSIGRLPGDECLFIARQPRFLNSWRAAITHRSWLHRSANIKLSAGLLTASFLLGSGAELWAQLILPVPPARLTPIDRPGAKDVIRDSKPKTAGEWIRSERVQEVVKKIPKKGPSRPPKYKASIAKEALLKVKLIAAEHRGIVGKPNLSKVLFAEGIDSRAAFISLDTRVAAEVLLKKYSGQPDIDPRTLPLDLQTAKGVAARKGPATNPVIFIPGIMGSRLRDPEKEWSMGRLFCGKGVWGYSALCSLGFFANLELPLQPEGARDRLQVDGLIDEVVVIDHLWTIAGYAETLRYLEEVGNLTPNETLFVLPYDWRQSNVEAATALDQLVPVWKKQVAKTHLAGKKFVIVAHSMGGLIAKYYVNQLGGDAEVERIVALGTPHLGAPLSLLAMGAGALESINLANYIYDQDTIRRVTFSMPSMFEMLPLELRGAAHDPEKVGPAADLDLTRVATWETYGLVPSFPGVSSQQIREILQKRLTEAVNFRRAIQVSKVPIDYIIGPHHPTVAGLELSSQKAPVRREGYGDGTVPLESAAECRRENCLRTQHSEYVAMAHGDIHRDPDARERILDFIKQTPDPSKPLPPPQRLDRDVRGRQAEAILVGARHMLKDPAAVVRIADVLMGPGGVSPVPVGSRMTTSYSDKRRELVNDIEYIETSIAPREAAPSQEVEIAVAIAGTGTRQVTARVVGEIEGSPSFPVAVASKDETYYASFEAPTLPGAYRVEFTISGTQATLGFNAYFLVVPAEMGPPT